MAITTEVPSAAVFPRIHAFETLLAAWARIEHNDGAAGVDGVTLDEFELGLETNLRTLERDLCDRLYRPQPLLAASLPKPSGGRRALAIPTVRDRVAQCAAALVITPLLEPEFEVASFGFRRRRGVPDAVAAVRRCYEQGYRWVVDGDIDNFFDEVDHARLLARLQQSIPDPELLGLVQSWLTAPLQDGTTLVERVRGLPQGAPISPVLANLYLDRFDEALLRRGLRLVRFADDFLILCKTRPKAEAALELTEAILEELSLALDPEKTRVTHFDQGFRYLGHLFARSLVVASPNRLQRQEALDAPLAGTPGASEAPAGPVPRRLRVVKPTANDTLIARALGDALRAAGRQSLVLPESAPSPLPEPAAATAVPAPAPGRVESEPSSVEAAEPPASPRRAATPFRRTLYIQEQGSVLAREGERLVVRKGEDILLDVPAAKVDHVFIFGRCAITTPAMTFCLQEEIPVVLLSTRGQYYGLLDSPAGDRVSLHRQQFARAADPAFCLATAKAIVQGKLANCRVLLQRQHRRKRLEEGARAIADLDQIVGRLPAAETLEEVHGHEGHGAARYFDAFARILQQDLGFAGRVRRPPTDPVNSLLSFGYTLCFYNLYALVRARGLHPYVGYLHLMRDRHPALASDLIEEFRAPIVDGLVLYLVNSRILTAADFYRSKVEPGGACLLRDPARKTFLKHFEQRMATSILHPRAGESVDWRRAMDLQVAHMAQWIRGEVGEYRPMEVR